ncbi:MAG: UDP-N-acetylmuramoyl-tripeptide--D-alanyl-D-alanine ligase, partial [bacterium]
MFSVKELLKLLPEACIIGKKATKVSGISIDSRTIKKGELYIPIKGDKHDGRKFIKAALAKGAIVLDVKDGIRALQKIAAWHRSKFNIPIIGVTGSVGKTTSKDMIHSILSQSKPTLKTIENFNNEIGVPLTLLRLQKKHKFAVIEMAMQQLGEIAELTELVRPTVSVITNIGEAHLEYLKNTDNVAKAKSEIFLSQNKNNYAV